jgi:transcriptional regulator GlxA family with amidase domain
MATHVMRRIGFVVYAEHSLVGVAAATAFEIANLVGEGAAYDMRFVSKEGGGVRSSSA